MKNSLEIVIFSEKNQGNETIVDWLTKSALPIIEKQEDNTKKLILKTLTGTPPIYMS